MADEHLPNRIIVCIAMKAFYALVSSVIRGLNPLKTKLAVVVNIKRSGSVVLAATPLLKKEGIKTGSRLFDIPKRKDIHGEIYQDFELYSSLVLQYVAPEDFYTYSIDELFNGVTASLHLFAETSEELKVQLAWHRYVRSLNKCK
ncbi:damage repair protein [Priestia aryabhattai]|uniref:Y-family DNA polymerase n=1 Tax=Priestia aryabhattai TaxID=412384 RepID=UPI0030CA10C6